MPTEHGREQRPGGLRLPIRPAARVTKPTRSRGQGLPEFVLILPVLLVLLGGVIQFAFILQTQISITNAVREASRQAASLPTADAATAVTYGGWARTRLVNNLAANVRPYASTSLSLAQVCYHEDPNNATQEQVTVTVTYLHPLFIPLISNILDLIDGTGDSTLHITTDNTMRVENAISGGTTFSQCVS